MFARKYGWPNITHKTRGLTVLSKTRLLLQPGFKRPSKKYIKTDVTCFVFVDAKY
jgi:hypothetical protein